MEILSTITDKTGEKYRVVRCGGESVRELARLERICFPEDFWSEISFTEALAVPACALFAAYPENSDEIAAYGMIYTAADEGDLANIAVLPEHRRRGLGKAFLSELCARAKERGALKLYLEVRESNEGARALYRSSDFTETGKRRNYYVNPREDAVIMEKSL